MKSLSTALLLLALALSAQTTSLRTALMAIGSTDGASATKQVVTAMTPLAQANHQPSHQTVDLFSSELVRVLAGRKITTVELATLETAITEVMRGSVPNFKSTGHLRDALTAMHIDSFDQRSITSRFLAIGEEVRGPDDLPLTKWN
jgi:hypothetical protein